MSTATRSPSPSTAIASRLALGTAFGASEQPPVDATFDVGNPDNAVKVVPSVDGNELDTDAIGAAIVRGVRTITATIRSEHPAHDTEVGEGARHHAPGVDVHDVLPPRTSRACTTSTSPPTCSNNTVVEPGQTFSLNDKLGPRTPEKGYVKAPILVDDGFGEDYGGGISQLTTTLYNAVFFGGYVDVEHLPHHFYISRYPMGREATIVFPYVDLKFRNDTQHGVLIRTSYSRHVDHGHASTATTTAAT